MTDSDKFVEMYSDKDSEKKLSFEEKLKMLNALGYISTGFNGVWTNGNVKVKILFNKDKIDIISIKKQKNKK